MKWFKHYSNVATTSESLADLLRDTGLQGYARYWLLIEFLAGLFDGESDSFRVPIETIRGLFRIRSWTELETFSERLSTVRGLDIKRNGNVFEIKAPILLELQGRDFRKARSDNENAAPKIKNKNKDKELDKDKEYVSTEAKNSLPVASKNPKKDLINFKISSTQEVGLSNELIMSWIDTYPKEFVEEEMKKARSWVLANQQKAPKSNWGKFFNSWLSRGWDQYRKTLKSNPTKLTEDDLSEILGGGL